MKKVSMYLVMLGILFIGISSFNSNVFSATSITTSGGDTICNSIYAPVCGVTYLEVCKEGVLTNCTKTPVYKTFSNKCLLEANKEGYSFYKEGACVEVQKSITVTAPTSVERGSTFTYSWNAVGGYEYCKPTGIIELDISSSGNGNLGISGSVKVKATTSTDNSSTMVVGVQCYYKSTDSTGAYKSDTKTATVKLTDPSVCNDIYAPVCGVTYLEVCKEGILTNCTKNPVYKTFSNKCLLEKNKEGYSYYKEGACVEVKKSITVSAPESVVKGSSFTYSWKAEGGYEYCKTIGIIELDTSSSGNGNLGISGSVKVKATTSTDNSSTMIVGVECYYKGTDSTSAYMSDTKTATVKLTDPSVCNDIAPVCGVKYLQSCPQGSDTDCSSLPVYKTFSSRCELQRNTANFTYFKDGNCDNIVDDTIKLTNSLKLKLDKSIKKLLDKIDQNYNNSADKIDSINVIIDKLTEVQNSKPKYINITKYVIDKLNEKIIQLQSENDPNIEDIINIIN